MFTQPGQNLAIKSEIEEFIAKRFPIDCNWLFGNCYYFALILSNRFPNSHIVYDAVKGHFMLELQKMYFDYTGQVMVSNENIYDWSKLQIEEPNWAKRIIEGCIL